MFEHRKATTSEKTDFARLGVLSKSVMIGKLSSHEYSVSYHNARLLDFVTDFFYDIKPLFVFDGLSEITLLSSFTLSKHIECIAWALSKSLTKRQKASRKSARKVDPVP